jgi:enoyl-CoA hydratase
LEYETIKVTIDDEGVARVTLNVPEKRNAISVKMMDEVQAVLKEWKHDPGVHVIVFDGEGPDFCAGHDLYAHVEITGKHRPWREDDARKYIEHIRENWYEPLHEYPKVLIAAVHGRMFAGGVEFPLLCDMTVASEDATFSYSVHRVTGASVGMMLPWVVGWKKAHELYILGTTVDAQEALRLGMVNYVVTRANLLAEATRLATIVARIPPEVVKLNKLTVRHAFNLMGMREGRFFGQQADMFAHLREGAEVESEKRFTDGLAAVVAERRARFEDLDVPYR